MTTIIVTDSLAARTTATGADFVAAAESLAAEMGWSPAADDCITVHGYQPETHCRDLNPREFWQAYISASMSDEQNWGYGETEAEAEEMAGPALDE